MKRPKYSHDWDCEGYCRCGGILNESASSFQHIDHPLWQHIFSYVAEEDWFSILVSTKHFYFLGVVSFNEQIRIKKYTSWMKYRKPEEKYVINIWKMGIASTIGSVRSVLDAACSAGYLTLFNSIIKEFRLTDYMEKGMYTDTAVRTGAYDIINKVHSMDRTIDSSDPYQIIADLVTKERNEEAKQMIEDRGLFFTESVSMLLLLDRCYTERATDVLAALFELPELETIHKLVHHDLDSLYGLAGEWAHAIIVNPIPKETCQILEMKKLDRYNLSTLSVDVFMDLQEKIDDDVVMFRFTPDFPYSASATFKSKLYCRIIKTYVDNNRVGEMFQLLNLFCNGHVKLSVPAMYMLLTLQTQIGHAFESTHGIYNFIIHRCLSDKDALYLLKMLLWRRPHMLTYMPNIIKHLVESHKFVSEDLVSVIIIAIANKHGPDVVRSITGTNPACIPLLRNLPQALFCMRTKDVAYKDSIELIKSLIKY